MKASLLSILLVTIIIGQLSYQKIVFKPETQTTGPYGRSSGTPFAFNMTSGFNLLPSSMVVSLGASGIHSLSFVYSQQIGQTVKTGGRQAEAIVETNMGAIVKAEVCTGIRSRVTVIIGVRFTSENGIVNYYHGNINQVSNFTCTDATPTTPGYYLQSLSGRYGTFINQLSFTWVSNFEEERACFNDPNCNQALDFCPSDYCCYQKSQTPDGQWVNSVMCA